MIVSKLNVTLKVWKKMKILCLEKRFGKYQNQIGLKVLYFDENIIIFYI